LCIQGYKANVGLNTENSNKLQSLIPARPEGKDFFLFLLCEKEPETDPETCMKVVAARGADRKTKEPWYK